MATRFYLPRLGAAPAVSPPFSAGWNLTSSAVRQRLEQALTKQLTALGATASAGTGVTAQNVLLGQFVSRPLAAQTITGSVSGQIMVFETTASNSYGSQIRVYLYRPTTSAVAVLWELEVYAVGSVKPPEWATISTNRPFPRALATGTLTSQTAADGDVLVVEVGFRQSSTGTTNGSMRHGDPAGTDLPVDSTTTVITDVPWIELSQNLTFSPLPTVIRELLQGVKRASVF